MAREIIFRVNDAGRLDCSVDGKQYSLAAALQELDEARRADFQGWFNSLPPSHQSAIYTRDPGAWRG